MNAQGKMALELRDEEAQEVTFQMIDPLNKQSNKAFKLHEANWWSSLLSLQNGLILLEQYPNAQDPSKKDLLIADVERMQLVHVERDFQFSGYDRSVVLGHDPGNQQLHKKIDLDGINPPFEAEIISPVFYAPGTESSQMVYDFLEKADPGTGCEYFESEDWIIICYYERLDQKFSRYLAVFKSESQIFAGQLDQNLSGFASGGFFIFNDLLIFIESSQHIHAIKLD